MNEMKLTGIEGYKHSIKVISLMKQQQKLKEELRSQAMNDILHQETQLKLRVIEKQLKRLVH